MGVPAVMALAGGMKMAGQIFLPVRLGEIEAHELGLVQLGPFLSKKASRQSDDHFHATHFVE